MVVVVEVVVVVEPEDGVVVLPVPAGAPVLLPAAEGVEVVVPAEAPAELGVELEPDVPDDDDESGVTCWEALAVDVPPPAFPPQPKAVVRTVMNRQQPSNEAEKFLIMTSRD